MTDVTPTFYRTAATIALRTQTADLCNLFANIADGPQWLPTATKTANYSALVWELVMCNPGGGTFTVTLPAPGSTPVGVSIRVKNTATPNAVSVAASGGSTIEGGATFSVTALRVGEFTNDGTHWQVVSAL